MTHRFFFPIWWCLLTAAVGFIKQNDGSLIKVLDTEFKMFHYISTMKTPYIALLDGITSKRTDAYVLKSGLLIRLSMLTDTILQWVQALDSLSTLPLESPPKTPCSLCPKLLSVYSRMLVRPFTFLGWMGKSVPIWEWRARRSRHTMFCKIESHYDDYVLMFDPFVGNLVLLPTLSLSLTYLPWNLNWSLWTPPIMTQSMKPSTNSLPNTQTIKLWRTSTLHYVVKHAKQ